MSILSRLRCTAQDSCAGTRSTDVTVVDKASSAERGEQRRRQILMAAADCFERRGFHGSSMAEISKVAGMSVGHIYHNFANKDAIIKAMAEARDRTSVE